MFRELDENGDIKNGKFIHGSKSVGFNVATQIQLWLRENPLDLGEGIDWSNEIPNINEGRLSAQIRDIAFKCNNVIAVSQQVKFNGIDDNRMLHIEFKVRTSFGDENIKVDVNADNY